VWLETLRTRPGVLDRALFSLSYSPKCQEEEGFSEVRIQDSA
jgi:hypothetical protein